MTKFFIEIYTSKKRIKKYSFATLADLKKYLYDGTYASGSTFINSIKKLYKIKGGKKTTLTTRLYFTLSPV